MPQQGVALFGVCFGVPSFLTAYRGTTESKFHSLPNECWNKDLEGMWKRISDYLRKQKFRDLKGCPIILTSLLDLKWALWDDIAHLSKTYCLVINRGRGRDVSSKC